jgi:hypothetical protein
VKTIIAQMEKKCHERIKELGLTGKDAQVYELAWIDAANYIVSSLKKQNTK